MRDDPLWNEVFNNEAQKPSKRKNADLADTT